MKKRTPWIVIASCCIAGGIGCYILYTLAGNERRRKDEVEKQVTLLKNELEQLDEQERIDSITLNFTSPDLNFHELKGHVRHLSYGEQSIDFDKDGNWTNPQAYITRGGNNVTFGRDKFGWIISALTPRTAEGIPLERVEYLWSGTRLKRIKSSGYGGEYQIDMFYNDRQNLAQVRIVSSDNESKSEIATTYTYHDFDKYGNWTRRTARSAIKTTLNGGYYDEDSNRFIKSDEPVIDSSEETETRVINYYTY